MPKVYLDETGFDTFYYRPYAYALRGQIVKARISGKRYERMSWVAARGVFFFFKEKADKGDSVASGGLGGF